MEGGPVPLRRAPSRSSLPSLAAMHVSPLHLPCAPSTPGSALVGLLGEPWATRARAVKDRSQRDVGEAGREGRGPL